MKQKRDGIRIIMLLALAMIGIGCLSNQPAYAAVATPVKVAAVEYYDDNIIVFNNDNTRIYYATELDAAKEDWEIIPVDDGIFTMIDISWVSTSSDTSLIVRGDIDKTETRVVIKEKPDKLAITINYTNVDNLDPDLDISSLVNIMSSEGTGQKPITFEDLEWKKGETGQWTSTKSLTVAMLEKFLIKGTYLYFRIRALDDTVGVTVDSVSVDLNDNRVNGIAGGIREYENVAKVAFDSVYPDGTDGRRFSNEVKVKVAKKSSSINYAIDGSKFNASIKAGKEYRVTVINDDKTTVTSAWISVTSRDPKKIPLKDMLKNVGGGAIAYDGVSIAFPEMLIEVRDYATTKTASSKISEIPLVAQYTLSEGTLPSEAIQEGKPDLTVPQDIDDIYVYYYGNKYTLLTIPMASTDLPYEYCIVKSGAIDLAQASWTPVTKGTGVKILISRAVDGGTLYVRQKEIKTKGMIASTCVSKKLNYPSVPVVTKDNLTFVKGGYTTSLDITIQLNVSGKVAFEDTIKSIKLGSKEIGFDSPVTSTVGGVSTMTVTLKGSDMELLTNCTNKALVITFENGTVDKTSIKLTLKNPTPAGALTLTPIKGSLAGKTKLSVASSLGTGYSWVYTIDTAALEKVNVEDTVLTKTGKATTAFNSGDEISVSVGDYITIYEINEDGNIIKYKSIQITEGMIL